MTSVVQTAPPNWLVRLRIANDAIETVLLYVAGAVFAAFIVVVLLQVIVRNIFQISAMLWTVELATLLFLWAVYLGATMALRQRRHYTLDVIPQQPALLKYGVDVFANICVAATLFVLLYAGTGFLDNAARRLSMQLGITQFWFFIVVPLSALAMLLFLFEVMTEDVRQLRNARSNNAREKKSS